MAKSYKTLDPEWRSKYTKGSPGYSDKKEYNKIGELYERLETMREAKHSQCYWGVDGGMHKGWPDRWDYLTKIVNMHHAAADEDDPRPNLKSTFAYNATETAMTEMYDLNLMPAVIPWTKKGEKLAGPIENIIKYPILKHEFNEVWLDGFQEALWIGNTFYKTTYTKIVKKAKFKKLKGFSKEELKRLEKDNEIAIYVDKEYVEYNDVDWLNVSPYEYYVDPFARRQHGRHFAAGDGIWERTTSFDAFESEFGNRRGFVNIDKVKASFNTRDEYNPLFRFPEEQRGGQNVVICEWENKSKDFVRYTANGVFIGEMPLPNHKQLSIIHVGAIKIPGQYYYMGLADVLEGLQTEDEVIRNKFIELLELQLSPPIVANNIVAGEFKEQYDVAKYNTGEIISISGSPSEIQWMSPAITRLSEVFGLRSQIREDVVSVSLIDPKASGQPTNSPSAFEAMQMTQATMKSFAKTLKSFSRGIKWGLKVQWAMQKQEYPLNMEPEQIEKRQGDKPTMLKSREIYSKDVEIIDSKGKIEVKNRPGGTYPFVVKDEYLDVDDDDLDIIISAESMQPMTKIAKVKKSEEAMAQLMPIVLQAKADPSLWQDPRFMMLMENYVIAHDIDRDFLSQDDEDDDEAIKRAELQEKIMMKNSKLEEGDPNIELVLSPFDEKLPHRLRHMKTLYAHQQRAAQKGLEIEELNVQIQESMPEVDPMMEEMMLMQGVPMPEPMGDPALEARLEVLTNELEEIDRFLQQLEEHFEFDKMSFEEASEALLAKATGVSAGQTPGMPAPDPMMQAMQAQQMGGMPMQGGMPQGGMPPMGPEGGMQIAPLDIPSPIAQSPQEMQMMG